MIQSYILYGIILLYKPVTVTGNTPRAVACAIRTTTGGGALLHTKTCMHVNQHTQTAAIPSHAQLCMYMHVSAVYVYVYI